MAGYLSKIVCILYFSWKGQLEVGASLGDFELPFLFVPVRIEKVLKQGPGSKLIIMKTFAYCL